MIKVEFPDGDSILNHLSAAIKIMNDMEEEFNKTKKISLDLSDVKWFIPCPMILISNKIRELLDHGATSIMYKEPKKANVRGHLQKIGFPLGTKEDGSSYVSIKHLRKDPNDKNQINREVNELVTVIEGKAPNKFGDSIKYILGELSDNIDEHSRFECASLMAQYFPKKEIVDIAVFDNGVSIPKLFEEHNIRFKGDSNAIKKAVWGEVTTKKNETRGFGLRTCKELSTEGLKGELYLVSRSGILMIKSSKEPLFYELKTDSLKGTFIYLRLKTPKKRLNIYKFVE